MAMQQNIRAGDVASVDPVWARIRREAEDAIAVEPLLGGMMQLSVLHHPSFERALSYRISVKLASGEMPALTIATTSSPSSASSSSLVARSNCTGSANARTPS